MNRHWMMRKLAEDGAMGADLSPGDPVCAEALVYIRELERELRIVVENHDAWHDDHWGTWERGIAQLLATANPEAKPK